MKPGRGRRARGHRVRDAGTEAEGPDGTRWARSIQLSRSVMVVVSVAVVVVVQVRVRVRARMTVKVSRYRTPGSESVRGVLMKLGREGI